MHKCYTHKGFVDDWARKINYMKAKYLPIYILINIIYVHTHARTHAHTHTHAHTFSFHKPPLKTALVKIFVYYYKQIISYDRTK